MDSAAWTSATASLVPACDTAKFTKRMSTKKVELLELQPFLGFLGHPSSAWAEPKRADMDKRLKSQDVVETYIIPERSGKGTIHADPQFSAAAHPLAAASAVHLSGDSLVTWLVQVTLRAVHVRWRTSLSQLPFNGRAWLGPASGKAGGSSTCRTGLLRTHATPSRQWAHRSACLAPGASGPKQTV